MTLLAVAPPSPSPTVTSTLQRDGLVSPETIIDENGEQWITSSSHHSTSLSAVGAQHVCDDDDDDELDAFLNTPGLFDDDDDDDGYDVGVEGEEEDNGFFDVFTLREGLDRIKTVPEIVQSIHDSTNDSTLTIPTTKQIIADTLQSMPMDKREQIVRELYGIEKLEAGKTAMTNHVINDDYPVITTAYENSEDPRFVQEKLYQMDQELHRLRTEQQQQAISGGGGFWNTTATTTTPTTNLNWMGYELAEQQNLQYTLDTKFRLKFLRCDRFDPKRAAVRFVRYLDWKLELFGPHTLCREITLLDLTFGEREMLKKGYIQRLPVRDRAGRAIWCTIYNGQQYESPQSLARQYFYMGCCYSDEETDKKGNICLFFKIKDFTLKQCDNPLGGCFYLRRVANDLPIRFDAYHKFLADDFRNSVMNKIVEYAINLMNPEIRARTNVHYGKHSDWMNQLMSFGIPQDVIPFTQSYKIKTKNHQEYMSMRTQKEEILSNNPPTNTPEQLIDLPTRKDVLLGKGKPIQFSSGNQRLSSIIDGYLDQYQQQPTRNEKTALAATIVQLVKASGVRFLSKECGIWMEISDDLARDKVSHMFRHQIQKTGGSKNNKSTTTGTVRRVAGDAMMEPASSSKAEEPAKRVKM